jgi:hypothetical protein
MPVQPLRLLNDSRQHTATWLHTVRVFRCVQGKQQLLQLELLLLLPVGLLQSPGRHSLMHKDANRGSTRAPAAIAVPAPAPAAPAALATDPVLIYHEVNTKTGYHSWFSTSTLDSVLPVPSALLAGRGGFSTSFMHDGWLAWSVRVMMFIHLTCSYHFRVAALIVLGQQWKLIIATVHRYMVFI